MVVTWEQDFGEAVEMYLERDDFLIHDVYYDAPVPVIGGHQVNIEVWHPGLMKDERSRSRWA